MKYIAIDYSIILHSCYAIHKRAKKTMNSMVEKYLDSLIYDLYMQFGKSKIFICVDSPRSWRMDVYPAYKANREYNGEFVRLAKQCRPIIDKYTVLEQDLLEADDLAAAIAHKHRDNAVLVSEDADWRLCVKYGGIFYSLRKRKVIDVENPSFEEFEKIVRGCKSDNIPPCAPRIYKKKLVAAYEDYNSYKILHKWIDKDQFYLNKRLVSYDFVIWRLNDENLEKIS